MKRGLVACLLVSLVPAPGVRVTAQTTPAAQAPAPAPQTIQSFGVEASRVLLDVIVRDGKDNPITDLTASDF
jgi:hypothetical protein